MTKIAWNDICDPKKSKKLQNNHEYLLCIDASGSGIQEWRYAIGAWYTKDSITIVWDGDGTPHRYRIEEDGFYSINHLNPKTNGALYRAYGVRYWADPTPPENSPDETLTIE